MEIKLETSSGFIGVIGVTVLSENLAEYLFVRKNGEILKAKLKNLFLGYPNDGGTKADVYTQVKSMYWGWKTNLGHPMNIIEELERARLFEGETRKKREERIRKILGGRGDDE